MTMKISHLLEVRRWVMGYRPECEVLEPTEVREEVCEQLRRGAQIYARG
jgi:hypothetical protein